MEDRRLLIKADKRLRVVVILLIGIVLAAAVFSVNLLSKYMMKVQSEADVDPELAIMKMVNILKAVVYINPIIFLLVFIYFVFLGTRTFRSQQYPPPGVKVIRDTYLVEGKKAKTFGIALWVLASILIIFALIFSFMMNNFIQTLI